MNEEIILEGRDLHKSYSDGSRAVKVLTGVNICVHKAERIAVVGASGSGKSTLLNVLGGLDKPTSGEVLIEAQAFSGLSDSTRGRLRNRKLGFVYQFHHLLPEFTALENILMPLRIGGFDSSFSKVQAEKLIGRVGLTQRASHKPAELSGGERQRIAIARALATQPACVLLDEPTGNLDKSNAANIRQLMNELASDLGTAFIVVTHDEHLANSLDTRYSLEDGKLHAIATTSVEYA